MTSLQCTNYDSPDFPEKKKRLNCALKGQMLYKLLHSQSQGEAKQKLQVVTKIRIVVKVSGLWAVSQGGNVLQDCTGLGDITGHVLII